MYSKVYTLRARFKKEIVAEFLPPALAPRRRKKPKLAKVIIFCDGMPSVPSKRSLLEFFSKKGYWVFHPRYRGSWESGGKFLAKSPHLDILDIISELPRGFKSLYEGVGWENGKIYKVKPGKIFVIGSSFGGPAVILASSDKRVTKAVAFSPVIDWRAQDKTIEPINWIAKFTRAAFGEGYRFSPRDWNKLKTGKFYNPIAEAPKIDGRKLLIIHAKDDKVVGWRPAQKFAKATGAKLILLKRGGHLSSSNAIKPRFYRRTKQFLAE